MIIFSRLSITIVSRICIATCVFTSFPITYTYGDPLVEYSIGNPSAEEQYIVELINRTRMNPANEGKILRASTDPDLLTAYQTRAVNLAMFESEMAAFSPVPPVAINARLSEGSLIHTMDMLNNAFQGHTGSDGSSAGDRITRRGV